MRLAAAPADGCYLRSTAWPPAGRPAAGGHRRADQPGQSRGMAAIAVTCGSKSASSSRQLKPALIYHMAAGRRRPVPARIVSLALPSQRHRGSSPAHHLPSRASPVPRVHRRSHYDRKPLKPGNAPPQTTATRQELPVTGNRLDGHLSLGQGDIWYRELAMDAQLSGDHRGCRVASPVTR